MNEWMNADLARWHQCQRSERWRTPCTGTCRHHSAVPSTTWDSHCHQSTERATRRQSSITVKSSTHAAEVCLECPMTYSFALPLNKSWRRYCGWKLQWHHWFTGFINHLAYMLYCQLIVIAHRQLLFFTMGSNISNVFPLRTEVLHAQ